MLDWVHRTDSIPADGQVIERLAEEHEREELRREFDLSRLDSLVARYSIRPLAKGRYLVDGNVVADVVQACVVTLDPVASRIDESFTLEFWPADQIGEVAIDFDALVNEEDPEPIERGRIPIGRIVSELVSLAIPPFPRADNVEVETATAGDEEDTGESESPFAALSRLQSERNR